MKKLKPICSYRGSKRRIADPIIEIMSPYFEKYDTIYDVCCGSGAVSMAMIDYDIDPSRIHMVDAGLFGLVFKFIGSGRFKIEKMQALFDQLPDDPRRHKKYLENYRDTRTSTHNLIYDFIFLQSATMLAKPIEFSNRKWSKTTINHYRSKEEKNSYIDTNTFTPIPRTIIKRLNLIIDKMVGVTGYKSNALRVDYRPNSLIYIDPPYLNTSGYLYDLNLNQFLKRLPSGCTVFVSEGRVVSDKNWLVGTLDGRDEYLSLITT